MQQASNAVAFLVKSTPRKDLTNETAHNEELLLATTSRLRT